MCVTFDVGFKTMNIHVFTEECRRKEIAEKIPESSPDAGSQSCNQKLQTLDLGRPKRRRQWAQKDMDIALAECREGGKSAAAAARDNDVPRKTLTDRLQGKVFKQVDKFALGVPKVFVAAEEHERNLEEDKKRKSTVGRPEKMSLWERKDKEIHLAECQEDGKSAAARDNSVPRKIPTDRLKDKHEACNCDLRGKFFPFLCEFAEEGEKSLANFIAYNAGRGVQFTVEQILEYARKIDNLCGDNTVFGGPPYEGWWLGFKKRHPEAAKLYNLESSNRVNGIFPKVDVLKGYFQLLKIKLMGGNFEDRPQDIYTVDEVVFNLSKSSQEVAVPMRRKKLRQAPLSEDASIICCVNAAGCAVPPIIVHRPKFPDDDFLGGPENGLYGWQPSGFMDEDLFVEWFEKAFCPYARPTPDRPVLLLIDNHASIISIDLIDCARENNVTLLALPPLMTRLCQPLDVVVHKSLKSKVAKNLKLEEAIAGNSSTAKRNFARCMKVPFKESMSKRNIKLGFQKCGIYPFNPNAIDKTRIYPNKTDTRTEDLDLSIPPSDPESGSLLPVFSAFLLGRSNFGLVRRKTPPEDVEFLIPPSGDIEHSTESSNETMPIATGRNIEELNGDNLMEIDHEGSLTAYIAASENPMRNKVNTDLSCNSNSSFCNNNDKFLIDASSTEDEPAQPTNKFSASVISRVSNNPLSNAGVISKNLAEIIPKSQKRSFNEVEQVIEDQSNRIIVKENRTQTKKKCTIVKSILIRRHAVPDEDLVTTKVGSLPHQNLDANENELLNILRQNPSF